MNIEYRHYSGTAVFFGIFCIFLLASCAVPPAKPLPEKDKTVHKPPEPIEKRSAGLKAKSGSGIIRRG